MGGLAPDYVLDRMELYEVNILYKNLHLRHRDSWEQTRKLMYITAQVNSTKQLKESDIMKFSWDEITPAETTTITETEIERLRKKSKQWQTL